MIIKWMLVMYIFYVTCTIIYFYCEWLSEFVTSKLQRNFRIAPLKIWSAVGRRISCDLQKPIVNLQQTCKNQLFSLKNSVGALLSILHACEIYLFLYYQLDHEWSSFFSGTSDWYMRECLSCINFLFVCSIISYFRSRSCLLLVYLSFTFLHITFKLFRQKQLLSNFYHSLMTENQMKNDQPMMNFDKTQRLMTSNSQQH